MQVQILYPEKGKSEQFYLHFYIQTADILTAGYFLFTHFLYALPPTLTLDGSVLFLKADTLLL